MQPPPLRAVMIIRGNLREYYKVLVTPNTQRVLELMALLSWSFLIGLTIHLHVSFVSQTPCSRLLPPMGENHTEEWDVLSIQVYSPYKGDPTTEGEQPEGLIFQEGEWRLIESTYTISQEKVLLFLSRKSPLRHHIRQVEWVFSTEDVCLGSSLTRLLLELFVGYDTLVLNHIASHTTGFVRFGDSYDVASLKALTESHQFLRSQERILGQFLMFTVGYPLLYWSLSVCVRLYCVSIELRGLPAISESFSYSVDSQLTVPSNADEPDITATIWVFYIKRKLAHIVGKCCTV